MQPLSFVSLSVVLLLYGCAAVPLVGIPVSNYLTTQFYEGRYEEYDLSYRHEVGFQELSIPRGEYSLYARAFGSWEDDEKPLVVLMHGFPDSLHIYDHLAPLLANDYRVLSFDFLGWGRSDKPRKHTYDTTSLVDDLDAVVSFLGTDKLSLVVHDASGPPGIKWALDNPKRLELLVLLNTYYHPMDALVKPEAIETFSTPSFKRSLIRTGARISNVGFRIRYQDQLHRFFCDQEKAELMVPVLTYQAMSIRRAFFQLNDVLDAEVHARANEIEHLESYYGDVLIVFGQDDPYLNAAVASEFHGLFPNSTLNTIDRAAHFVQLDRPEAVAAAILGRTSPVKKQPPTVQAARDIHGSCVES